MSIPFRTAALLAVWLTAGLPASAQGIFGGGNGETVTTRFFRIGTGATSETHFMAGGLVANVISKPIGSRPCDRGGSCGVPGLVAVAQTASGSVANVQAVAQGQIEAALVQADIAHAAATGVGPFKGKPPVDALRGIALLYPDTVHLVARKEAAIRSVADLKGKRVSLGEMGSGTLVDARAILDAYGVKERDLKAEFLRTGMAAGKLAEGALDAFFVVDGVPVPAIADLARNQPINLVPLDGAPAEKLREKFPFFMPSAVAAEAYAGLAEPVMTLDVPLVLVVNKSLPEDLAYGIARALWAPSSRDLLAQSAPRGAKLLMDQPTKRMGVPLHNGASAFYYENGLIE